MQKGSYCQVSLPMGGEPGEEGELGGDCHSVGANFYSLELHKISSAKGTPTWGMWVAELVRESGVSRAAMGCMR